MTPRPLGCLALAGLLFLAGGVAAEIYVPPTNVIDPAARPDDREASDATLPYLYLEPHDVAFDRDRPPRVTVYAVNRGGRAVAVDWDAVAAGLTLEPVGAGAVQPVAGRAKVGEVEVPAQRVSSITLDLTERFEVRGGAVYRLSYARPLDDGRVHVAAPVAFVVEDPAAVAAVTGGLPAGPARDTVAALLRANPVFFRGGGLKTYGWDARDWPLDPEMQTVRWQKAHEQAAARWREGLTALTAKGAPDGHARALEALIDRLLVLSDQLRVPLDQSLWTHLHARMAEGLPPAARERIYLKLVRGRDRFVVSGSLNGLSGLRSAAGLDPLFGLADGPDKELAAEAISALSNYPKDPRIARFLRRKMTDPDPALALDAAIVSCYSGDWSGFPVLLRCARSPDPGLREKAIGQLVSDPYRPHAKAVVPLLLAELKRPLSTAVLERAIDSLGSYPSDEVAEAVTPFLRHDNELVRTRARLTLDAIRRERGK